MARIPVPTIQPNTPTPEVFQQPDARGGVLQDYASNVDQGLSKVANQAGYYAELRENDQATAWAMNAASQFKLQQQTQMRDAENSTQGGADGFTGQTIQNYDKASDDLINTAPTPRAAQYLRRHLDTYRDTVGDQAVSFEMQQGRAFRGQQVQDATKNSSNLVFQDPSQYPQELASIKSSIAGMQLHPSDKMAWADNAEKQLTDAYWMGRAQKDPQGTANELKGVLPENPQSLPAQVKTAATASGVDPHVALAIAHVESGLNPEAHNPSGADGLFQMMPATWQQYAPPGADPKDPDAQMQAGMANLSANNSFLTKQLGRTPTPGELYMTQLGPKFAADVLKAPPTQTLDSLGYKQTADANGMHGMTAGQARTHWDQVMAYHMQQTQGDADAPTAEDAQTQGPSTNPALNNLGIIDRMKYLAHAQSLANKDNSQQKMTLEGQVQDNVAAYKAGKTPPNEVNPGDLYRVLPAPQAAKLAENLLGWKQYGFDVSTFNTASNDQIMQTLKARTPTPGQGFAGDEERFNQLKNTASDVVKARQADPALAAQTQSGLLKPIDLNDQTNLTGALSARFIQSNQVSRDYQTPYTPFSKPEADELSTKLANSTPQQASDLLATLRTAADSPQHYMAALKQIAPNQPVLALAGAIGDKNPAVSATIMQGAAMLRPVGEKKETSIVMPPDSGPNGLKQAWQTMGAPEAYDTAHQDSADAAFEAAKAYYVAKQPPGQRSNVVDPKLWTEAVNASTGGLADAGNGKKTLPPYGMAPEQFPNAVASVWNKTLTNAGYDPAVNPQSAFTLHAKGPGTYTIEGNGGFLRDNNTHQPIIVDINDVPQQASTPPDMTRPNKSEVMALRSVGGLMRSGGR